MATLLGTNLLGVITSNECLLKWLRADIHLPPIKGVRILEAHRVRSGQERAQAAQNEAVSAQKRLAKELAPETREELEQVIAKAAVMAANPTLPTTGPIFVSANGTPLNNEQFA